MSVHDERPIIIRNMERWSQSKRSTVVMKGLNLVRPNCPPGTYHFQKLQVCTPVNKGQPTTTTIVRAHIQAISPVIDVNNVHRIVSFVSISR